MDRCTEIRLIQQLLDLHADKSAFLVDDVGSEPVSHYVDSNRFASEQQAIFAATPQPLVHASELPEAGSFLRRTLAGLPLLLTRDTDGETHAFINVCRHRGTRLVDAMSGCKRRFSCPYHAWTWDNRGRLVGIPHEQQGFPGIDKSKLGLHRVGCVEHYGWIWVQANAITPPDIDAYLAGLTDDFEALHAEEYRIAHCDELEVAANWKLIVEGGIEAYHFRVTHRDTIGPFFMDNLSTFEQFGSHLRSVLARRTVTDLHELPQTQWHLRAHAQVLYSVFPANQYLVQSDHFAWIQLEPIAADRTRLRIQTMVPCDRLDAAGDLAHWQKNHTITMDTLAEDFAIGESIQSGLTSGANTALTFGRFEGALGAFNRCVAKYVGSIRSKGVPQGPITR
ncbi:MAG: SRPBCC family protein [Pseudomonadota bacterium]